MPLAVITVVYQNYTVLEDFFLSLKNQTCQDFHVFIIDGSDDKREIDTQSLSVTVIPAENKGYAHAINVGVGNALKEGYDRFCIVNSDVIFAEHFVKSALSSIQAHPASLIGGKIYYAAGFEYHKNRYKNNEAGKVVWYAGGEIDWNHVLVSHRGVDEVDSGQYEQFEETGFVTGCLVCYDKALFEKVGAWDEGYFMYYEDADYSVRVIKKGLSIYYDPSIVLWHKNAQSSDGSGSDFHVRYQRRNRLRFSLRYAPIRTKAHLIKLFLFSPIINLV